MNISAALWSLNCFQRLSIRIWTHPTLDVLPGFTTEISWISSSRVGKWYYWTTARSWVFPWHSRNHVVTRTIAATGDLEVTFQLYITGLTGNTDTNIIQYLCACSTFPDLSMPNCLTQHVSKWVKTIDLQRICLPFFGHDPHVSWAYARCPLHPTLLKCQLSMKFPLGLSYPLQFLIAINNKFYRTIHIIWVNYNDLTATSLE